MIEIIELINGSLIWHFDRDLLSEEIKDIDDQITAMRMGWA